VLSNVTFFTASDYLSVPAGEHQFQVTPAGQPASSAVIDARATVEAGKAYTVAATGPLASIKPAVVADNLAAPSGTKAKVRVLHFSPDAPAVDVKVANGPTLLSNLAFPNASNYLEVDPGTYDIQVTPAGGSDVVLNLAGTQLQAGIVYDVFAVGQVANIRAEVKTFDTRASTGNAGAQPSQLPSTGGESLPLAVFAGVAVALLAGGFVARRQMR
jgi:LPXTG-motif cell wall-anchored protein